MILYDSLANYIKPEENQTLRAMRAFLLFTLKKWGLKIREDDFELLYADTAKQSKPLECGAYTCKFLNIIYQKQEKYNSPRLLEVRPLDVEFFKNELQDLIQLIGTKNVIPESVFSRF